MWDLSKVGNVWTEGTSTGVPTASYLSVMREIHVLLVDHDPEGSLDTGKMLEMCQYKVTLVDLASSAAILSSRKTRFDVVMANINSPDLQGYKLMQLAVSMDIPIVLLSVDDNTFTTMRAIENGAFLCIQKPVPMEMLKYLWQNVMRERARKMVRDQMELISMTNNCSTVGVDIELRDMVNHMDESLELENFGGNSSNVLAMPNDYKGKGKQLMRESDDVEKGYGVENLRVKNHRVKKKVCTEWTEELHSKFADAVETLGEGRCFPKEILELMNVPGLTRMQVASHLQKCRNENWRSPEERKNQLSIQSDSRMSPQPRTRRFGSMPRLTRSLSYRTNAESSQSHSEPGESGLQNMIAAGPMDMANNGAHNCGQLVPQVPEMIMPHGAGTHHSLVPGMSIPHVAGDHHSSKPGHLTDDFFNFPDMDILIQGLANSVPQASGGFDVPSSNMGGYHYDPFYDNQNGNPGNHWNRGPSNYGNHASDSNAHG